ncbi:GH92 family glycosyl hydrolase [Prevotella sp. E9-3]|uniref:GH92 family glycosyl hydrolase n=1 Tax=Prevotella sp. E9-3 TaxID=2913621 RepID=UPI001EDC1EF8|nr:GH92 family glycosyl hydrolase [Prevotella sp. E9-3]UKK47921.1 GH92 family glycosyl hydrolase [Prevotella sp. E9-3]
MKKLYFLVLTMLTVLSAGAQQLTSFVDPLIGSGGHGHVFVGANVPFGMVQLGPIEKSRGWDWTSGYHYSDSIIVGFSHLHLNGTGCGDLGDIAFLPVSNAQQREIRFTHDQEAVRPGYYLLDTRDVAIELTATKRVGMHRYSFRQNHGQLRIDLNEGVGDILLAADLRQVDDCTIEGYRKSRGWAPRQEVYFSATFNTPVRLWEPQPGEGLVDLLDTSNPVLVKVALSPVSSEKARQNMEAELPGWDFDKVCEDADKAWERELARVRIETSNAQDRKIFYTSMYHLMVAPSEFCDVDLQYRGSDGRVYDGDFTNYTTLSLWDTYRAFHPLMTLIYPELQADYAETFIKIFEQQGRLPIWHLWGSETDCMVGSSAVPVLADLVLKGFVRDPEQAFRAMKVSQLQNVRSLGLLKQYGYIPYDKEPSNETVAKALEYCLDEDGLAQVAKQLGHEEDYTYFFNRSRSYEKYFDRELQFMRALGSDGNFRSEFDPIKVIHRADDYTEGNAWQYTWLVPHDVHGLISLFGGEQSFLKKLDEFFVTEGDMGPEASPDISGFIGQYAHGNEPSHHIIYLYNYAGQPWKAAPKLRYVMRQLYHAAPDGLCGNEDVGQMSAWYILSSLGLYQVEPSGGRFILGTPLFPKAEVSVGQGKTVRITARNLSDKNIYVQGVRLNGKKYTKTYIDFATLSKGATIEFQMGARPSKWGTAADDRP